MAVLNLVEAAEQAGTSKIDVWRAIQEGALPAQKTSDGGYAIDPADLFRVFETKQPEAPNRPPAHDEAVASTPEAAEDSDVAVAFAALQAELRLLLGAPNEATPSEHDACPAADRAATTAKAGAPTAPSGASADVPARPQLRRPWWARLR